MGLRIGLTGGIASGKSTVCNLFIELGIEIIDADRIARDLLAKNNPCYQQVVTTFGNGVLLPDGEINRPWLRQHIFANAPSKKKLEHILHPVIRTELLAAAARCQTEYCILAVPLLFEADMQDLVDRILTIDVPEGVQLQRLCERDMIPQHLAQMMIDSQYPRQRRLQLSDDIIDNSGPLTALHNQVVHMHEFYLQLAAKHH